MATEQELVDLGINPLNPLGVLPGAGGLTEDDLARAQGLDGLVSTGGVEIFSGEGGPFGRNRSMDTTFRGRRF